MKEIMNTKHPNFDKFCQLLEGEEGCNFRKNEKGETIWNCKGRTDKSFATAILKKHFPKVNTKKTLQYFEENGGYCDCEILFNIANVTGSKKSKGMWCCGFWC